MREEHRRRVLGERSTDQGGGKRRGVSAKKVLKANARRRILSWSNWEVFKRFLLQSDSPDDAVPVLLGIVGEKRQSRRFYSSAGGFAVWRPLSVAPSLMVFVSQAAWRYSPRSAAPSSRYS